MNQITTVLTVFFLLISMSVLFGQGEECRKKCAEECARCRNDCRAAAAGSAGCEERCVKQRVGCDGACGGMSLDSSDADLDDEGMEEDLGGDDFGDLEELEDLDYPFDGVDGMPDDGWGDIENWNDWNIED